MKEIDKKKVPNNNQTKRTRRTDRRDVNQGNVGKNLNGKKTDHKATVTRADSGTETNRKEPSETYVDVAIDSSDDAKKSEEASRDLDSNPVVAKEKNGEALDGNSSDIENESKQGTEEISDSDTIRDSVSSQGDSLMAEDDKVERGSRMPETAAKDGISESGTRRSRVKPDKSQSSAVSSSPRTQSKSNKGKPRVANGKSSDKNPKSIKVPSKALSESSEGVDEKPIGEVKDVDPLNGASNDVQSVASDTEVVDIEENSVDEDKEALEQKVEEMERRVEKLEEELRVVAALEISLYSMVPEHGSSAHKVHTPARRLSRLYIHACKHWTQDKRAMIAKNTVSGLVLISKSCGNDVPRLTYWLSNIVVLREIISQTFGSSRNSNSVTKFLELNGGGHRTDGKSATLKWKGGSASKQANGVVQFIDDWQETATFTAALEKAESWIFSRMVESVWWQAMTPHMQSPVSDLSSSKSIGKLSGPALGDQKQGSFSIDQWKNAFHDASQRLCPVRAGGHECGCLPVLARMVMETCINRLDVAIFNAILRESAHEIPTDPISDPIVDSKVLPIPAGDLSFGSGAQLKNAVGNWSRSLTAMFGMNTDDSQNEDQPENGNDDRWGRDGELKCFPLLDSLSDLLMLPKDMLLDRSIRNEVCPLISLSLVIRILCNFSPDEFCPDSVPGAVLEALNTESITDSTSGDSARTFPYTAAPVVYIPPSAAEVGEKIAEAGVRSQLLRNVSSVQRKGYTSDEELEELESPLTSIIDKLPSSPHTSTVTASGNGHVKKEHGGINARYELLHEVWSNI